MCTTHWRLTNNFYSPNLPHGVYSAPKNQNLRPHRFLSSDFVTGTKIAITWYSNYSHSSRSSSPQHLTQTKRSPPPPQTPQKSSILPHMAILVPYDELVMKSYMHVWLAIIETHYHNLNANIKNQDYWLLTSSVGIKIQKALNCSTGLQNTGLFSHILGTSRLQNGTK